jgi:hypothetical protein
MLLKRKLLLIAPESTVYCCPAHSESHRLGSVLFDQPPDVQRTVEFKVPDTLYLGDERAPEGSKATVS